MVWHFPAFLHTL